MSSGKVLSYTHGMNSSYLVYCTVCIIIHQISVLELITLLLHQIIYNEVKRRQEAPQCDETRCSTIQLRIDVIEIRKERWQ